MKEVLQTKHFFVPKIKFIGWFDVYVIEENYGEYYFQISYNGVSKNYNNRDHGYDYLYREYYHELKNAIIPDNMN